MGVWSAFHLGVLVAAAAAVASPAEAFVSSFGGGGSKMLRVGQRHQPSFPSSGSCSRQRRRAALGMKYVPDGLSPEQWKKMQKEEAERKKKMGDLGQVTGRGEGWSVRAIIYELSSCSSVVVSTPSHHNGN